LADQVFVIDGYENFSIHSVTDVGDSYSVVVPSDVLQKRIKIDISDTSFSPVFNLSSQFIGVTNSLEEGIVPIEVLFSDFSSLLANDKIIRPSLGVNTLSLAHTIDFSDKNYSEYKVGALIYGAGVKRYSVAESAGLKKGDIILSIDGQGINKFNTLDQYVVMHKPGDKIELIVDREGEEKIFSIELGTK
jgi:S1-C subfamily serine protease